MTMQRNPLLLWRLLDRGAWIAPDEEVVTLTSEGVHRQSYRETRARACRLANALASHGIARGDRVASFMWNNHRHLEMYQASSGLGIRVRGAWRAGSRSQSVNQAAAPGEVYFAPSRERFGPCVPVDSG